MNVLATAIRIAAQAHETQKDRAGKAYILHPIRVMMRLRTEDEELMAIAILHDVLEDSDITIPMLAHHEFPTRVIDALILLKHDPKDDYEVYIRKICTNADSMMVKLEDFRDNSDITRLKGLSEKDFERMEKYHRAYTYLKGVLATYKTAYSNA